MKFKIAIFVVTLVAANILTAQELGEIRKPDPKIVEQIRKEFLKLEKPLKVRYSTREPSREGGSGLFGNKTVYLEATLIEETAEILEDRGYKETGFSSEPVFALYPYLNKNDYSKEAYVILRAFLQDAYLLDSGVESWIPYSDEFDEAEWTKQKEKRIIEIQKQCKRALSRLSHMGIAYNENDLEEKVKD